MNFLFIFAYISIELRTHVILHFFIDTTAEHMQTCLLYNFL